jgi:oligoribonuclease (3'-5' exoribonuclease)
MDLISVDIETTGLDPQRHEIWEIACVRVKDGARIGWKLPFYKLAEAEPSALLVGDFYANGCPDPDYCKSTVKSFYNSGKRRIEPETSLPGAVAEEVAKFLNGATLLGCSVHFDAEFLRAWLSQRNQCATWHHRHLDLGSFAAGAWGAKSALSGKAMSDRYPNPDAHNAMADALWNVQVYENIRRKRGSQD